MQVANPTYHEIKHQVTSCITALESLRHMKGPNLAQLAKDFPKDPPADGETDYGGHIVKDTLREREKYNEAVSLFLDEIIVRLETMLPDSHIMEAFDSLWTKKEDDSMIQKLISMYGHAKTKDGVLHQAIIEPRARQIGCPDARDNQKTDLGNQILKASCPVGNQGFCHTIRVSLRQ